MDLISIDCLTDAEIATILDEGERWFDYNRQPRRNERWRSCIQASTWPTRYSRPMSRLARHERPGPAHVGHSDVGDASDF